jgi:hypothetical protein
MNAKRLLLSIVLLLTTFICSAQINYSYTDPCTGVLKTITVPSNGVTVTYYGQIKTFAPADFYSGAFETWSQGVFSSFGNNNPCASVVGLPAAVNVAQNSAINFLGIVNSLSSLADLASGSTNITSSVGSAQNVGGSGNGSKGSSSKSSKNNSNGNTNGNNSNNSGTTGSSGNGSNGSNSDNNGSQTSGSGTTGGSTTGGSTTGGTTTGGSTTGGTTTGGSTTGGSTTGGTTNNGSNGNSSGTGSNGNGNGTGNGSGGENTQTETEGGGKTNVVGSGVGSVQNSTGGSGGGSKSSGGPTSKNGNRPSILASSDFVGFNFQNSEVKRGGKVTAGYTAMRWDGKRSSGINVDYTTAMKGPNITAFYAFMSKKRIDLISTSLTMGFDVKRTTYGTLALGQMWTIKKNVKAVYMLTGSYGNVAETPFIGTAAIAGGMWDVKVKKSIDIKMLFLYVYAPYVSYYNDILLKSPHVVLPIVGTNIGVTKRFKVNINVGGAWALNENALNYTVMMGTRMLL